MFSNRPFIPDPLDWESGHRTENPFLSPPESQPGQVSRYELPSTQPRPETTRPWLCSNHHPKDWDRSSWHLDFCAYLQFRPILFTVSHLLLPSSRQWYILDSTVQHPRCLGCNGLPINLLSFNWRWHFSSLQSVKRLKLLSWLPNPAAVFVFFSQERENCKGPKIPQKTIWFRKRMHKLNNTENFTTHFVSRTPPKTNMTMENHLKMYLQKKSGDFPASHVSLLEGISSRPQRCPSATLTNPVPPPRHRPRLPALVPSKLRYNEFNTNSEKFFQIRKREFHRIQ